MQKTEAERDNLGWKDTKKELREDRTKEGKVRVGLVKEIRHLGRKQ